MKRQVIPGLEEALHPEIGNGEAWETDPHAAAVRSVDPLKWLDSMLFGPEKPASFSDEENGNMTLVQVGQFQPVPPTELPKSPLTETLPPRDEPALKDPHEDIKGADSKKKKKKQPEKAGKLARKVAKSEAQKKTNTGIQKDDFQKESQGESLSLFTQWIKSLKGSEYVHPYDDDFAIRQAEGPGPEGISATYADLLAAQGHTVQAIEMYRRLMEKFPEKSLFFAAKIEALQ